MFKTILISAALVQASGAKILDEDHKIKANTVEMIKEINAMKTTWTAGANRRFANATRADVKALLGTVMPGDEGYMEPAMEKQKFGLSASAIPESFDVRTNWPACAAITGRVRDQSNCGSCWAFGSTEAYNDRNCIANGDTTTVFSAEDTAACCSGLQCSFSNGCNGGQPSGAWGWFTKTGVSSGLDYADVGKGTSCKPYTLQSCAHHTEPAAGQVSCTEVETYKTPACTSTCSESTYSGEYKSDKHFAKSSYSVKSVENMQKELMELGTLSVAFTVYEDFEAYTGGVYQHVSGKSLGGHAVKMIGWGVDNGTPYWICTNSWNDSWGEQGTFRILRGNNECGIEGSVVAGEA
jgi:cathepsin B